MSKSHKNKLLHITTLSYFIRSDVRWQMNGSYFDGLPKVDINSVSKEVFSVSWFSASVSLTRLKKINNLCRVDSSFIFSFFHQLGWINISASLSKRFNLLLSSSVDNINGWHFTIKSVKTFLFFYHYSHNSKLDSTMSHFCQLWEVSLKKNASALNTAIKLT